VAELGGSREREPRVRPRLADACRVFVEDRGDASEIAERGGRRQIVGGSARDEQSRRLDIARTLVPHSAP
jgi:hypothetical protein